MSKFFNILSMLLLSISMVGCTSNGDDPTPPNPEPGPGAGDFTETQKTLTPEHLIGSWEIYSFNKKINSNSPLRYIEADGFSITFKNATEFYESNANPAEQQHISEGTYKVLDGGTQVKFFYKTVRGETGERVRTMKVSDKRLITVEAWDDKTTRVEDTKLWRNKVTLPTGHPFVDKEKVSLDRLKGTWEIYSYQRFYAGKQSPNSAELAAQYIGQAYEFKADKTFVSYAKDGKKEAEGPISIVDDVIHLFYQGEDITGTPSGEGGKEGEENETDVQSSTFWIKNWRTEKDRVTGEEFEVFTIYDKFISRLTGSNALITIEMITNVRKRK